MSQICLLMRPVHSGLERPDPGLCMEPINWSSTIQMEKMGPNGTSLSSILHMNTKISHPSPDFSLDFSLSIVFY